MQDNEARGLAQATAEAQTSLEDFIAALQENRPGRSGFAIMAPFASSGGGREHVWLAIHLYRDGAFYAEVTSDPVAASKIKAGQLFSVAEGQVTDWMYIEAERLVGGYSIRLERSRLAPEEREAFDRELPFRVE
ncbi:MAG TPA: DUF2314 domain-containing protein [Dehalococcoidia bacterium]|nr:DUF2314 domain-containing protein [Dehalococcoidia bacterium]